MCRARSQGAGAEGTREYRSTHVPCVGMLTARDTRHVGTSGVPRQSANSSAKPALTGTGRVTVDKRQLATGR
jgi:hypothetical protein